MRLIWSKQKIVQDGERSGTNGKKWRWPSRL